MARIHSFYPRDLLDNKQAAEYAGVAESTIRQWKRRGLLEPALAGEGRGAPTLYNRPEIDEVKRKLAEAKAERDEWTRELITPGEAPPLPEVAEAA
ncbi:MerR family transcriptional regulator [Streptomyces sp. NPDC057575]|uniref:MerR family transcriptional regulator n=1 Tax=unclassified Streptomyces TaxID=2593676 RepID=UPI0036AF1B1E